MQRVAAFKCQAIPPSTNGPAAVIPGPARSGPDVKCSHDQWSGADLPDTAQDATVAVLYESLVPKVFQHPDISIAELGVMGFRHLDKS